MTEKRYAPAFCGDNVSASNRQAQQGIWAEQVEQRSCHHQRHFGSEILLMIISAGNAGVCRGLSSADVVRVPYLSATWVGERHKKTTTFTP
jgi:hypothetical protein